MALKAVRKQGARSPTVGRKGVAFDYKPIGKGFSMQRMKCVPVNHFISAN